MTNLVDDVSHVHNHPRQQGLVSNGKFINEVSEESQLLLSVLESCVA